VFFVAFVLAAVARLSERRLRHQQSKTAL